jgi:hypothetical protein
MTITRYHNGDMSSQRFLTKVSTTCPSTPRSSTPPSPQQDKK